MGGATGSALAGGWQDGGPAVDARARVEAERRGTPHLVLRDGEGRQQIIDLAAAGTKASIGRSEDAEVSLAWDAEVSRLHAELEHLAGTWTLSDDGLSMNGTYVNHELLRARTVLRDGDVIRVGESHLVFRDRAASTLKTRAPEPTGPGIVVTPAQHRVLIALCRPFASGSMFATPASNQQIAEELVLSIDAVKGHVRLLFRAFDVDSVDRDRRRTALAERAFGTGTVSWHDFEKP